MSPTEKILPARCHSAAVERRLAPVLAMTVFHGLWPGQDPQQLRRAVPQQRPPAPSLTASHRSSPRPSAAPRLSQRLDELVVPWHWPDMFAGITGQHVLACQHLIHGKGFRADPRAEDWVGYHIAPVLGRDPVEDRAALIAIIKSWLANGALTESIVTDDKRRPRKAVDVGVWATADDTT